MNRHIAFRKSNSVRGHSYYDLVDVNGLTSDEKADQLINKMIASMAPLAVMPIFVSLPLQMNVIRTKVKEIGLCYGSQLDDEEAWQLVKQFLHAAGFGLMGMFVCAQIVSIILAATGAGYVAAIALSATVSTSLGYITGACAKAYFNGERNKKTLGAIARSHLKIKRNKPQV